MFGLFIILYAALGGGLLFAIIHFLIHRRDAKVSDTASLRGSAPSVSTGKVRPTLASVGNAGICEQYRFHLGCFWGASVSNKESQRKCR
jgi:hypothetical protein